MRRLFFALELDSETRAELEQLVSQLKHKIDNVKWVPAALMHVTVKFLGNTPENQLPEILDVAADTAGRCPPTGAVVAGIGAFPSRSKPRIVWAGVRGELAPLVTLARQLDAELEPLGFESESRSFSPHVTLGRARRKQRIAAIDGHAARYDQRVFGRMNFLELTLFESQLTPTGPIYTSLHRIPLGNKPH